MKSLEVISLTPIQEAYIRGGFSDADRLLADEELVHLGVAPFLLSEIAIDTAMESVSRRDLSNLESNPFSYSPNYAFLLWADQSTRK